MNLPNFKMTSKISKSVERLNSYKRIPLHKVIEDKDFNDKYPQLNGIKFGKDSVGFIYVDGDVVVAILLAKIKRYNVGDIHKIRVFEDYKSENLELGLIHSAVIDLNCVYAIHKIKDKKTIAAFEEYGFEVIETTGGRVLLSALKLAFSK